jgi:rhomboid protease GluP
MTESLLFLIVVSLTGIFALRWMLKLAPWTNELPLKTGLATLLAGYAAASAFLPYTVPQAVTTVALVVSVLYIFGPLLIIGLARARRFGWATVLLNLLYWSTPGRQTLRRLLAQVALQQGDTATVRNLIPIADADHLLLSQLYSLEGQWDKILSLTVPESGDNAFLARAARVQAYLQLERIESAEAELNDMRGAFERAQGPIGFRAVQLSELRLAAERGQFEVVRQRLQQPFEGVLPHVLLQIAARAAERAEQPNIAHKLYEQAYGAAPEALRPRFADKLRSLGQEPPKVIEQPLRWYGTLGLLIVIGLSYAVQLWLEATYGANVAWAVAAFVLNIPGIPEADALWRMMSYAFLHGGWVHIGFNAWVLFDIGKIYEFRRGWGNVLASFVFGSLLGGYLTLVAQGADQVILVGASGGILGIVGALMADVIRSQLPQDRLLLRSLLQWMVFLIIFSVAIPNVSLWGHVGGVVGGLLWGFIRQGLPENREIDTVAGLLSIGVMAYALYRAFLIFSQYVL